MFFKKMPCGILVAFIFKSFASFFFCSQNFFFSYRLPSPQQRDVNSPLLCVERPLYTHRPRRETSGRCSSVCSSVFLHLPQWRLGHLWRQQKLPTPPHALPSAELPAFQSSSAGMASTKPDMALESCQWAPLERTRSLGPASCNLEW